MAKDKQNKGRGTPWFARIRKKTAKVPTDGSIPLGRTLKTKDEFLPHDTKKVVELKDKRWVAVIDKNGRNELAVVKLTDENTHNTTRLMQYLRGNRKTTYFKHFVEITDNNGKPIKVDGIRFIENDKEYDLTKDSLQQIDKIIFVRSKQAPENRKKKRKLHERDNE